MDGKSTQELINRRLNLRGQMLEILSDEMRYQSVEFAECTDAIFETNERLHTLGINVMSILHEFALQERRLLDYRHPTAPSPKMFTRLINPAQEAGKTPPNQLPVFLS
jgi:hypothetical protein